MILVAAIAVAVLAALALSAAAAGAYTNGIENTLIGSTDWDTSTLKLTLIKDSYTYDPDHDFVNDVTSAECDATGFNGGFAGADRNVCAITVTEQTASNRVVCILTDETYSAIGGASNNTLESALLMREVSADSDSIPLVYLEFSATVATNGSDISVDNDGTNGNVRWTA